jgi:hypothetical protein
MTTKNSSTRKEFSNKENLFNTMETKPSNSGSWDKEEEDQDRLSPTSVVRTTEELEEALAAAQAQRVRMVTNIKKKKALLEKVQLANKDLEAKHGDATAELVEKRNENTSLRYGLQSVAAVRDDLKAKLRVKQEVMKEVSQERDDMERQLKRCLQLRETEQKLLVEYRRLAQHTGYYRWGKQIRMHESELDAAAEIEKAELNKAEHN